MSEASARTGALVVAIPSADALFADARFPSDADGPGAPPHVTIVAPFAVPDALTPNEAARLQLAISGLAPFDAAFGAVRRFDDGTAWLAPDDPDPFRRLTAAVAEAFPAWPPSRGEHTEVIPHLTLAAGARAEQAEALAREALPLEQRVTTVTYGSYSAEPGSWRTARTFRLIGRLRAL